MVFVTSGVASAGLTVGPRDVLSQVRHQRFVCLVLVDNFLVATVIASGGVPRA